ncbi:hypothetical protein RhiirA4_393605 [Rhizophagus irregularis]|uniref:Uncharacterized protein n=1 Tax=Rhizophagus irregularis TaxID=588596 RepID=A0A2I1FYV4_9GLOM|nr:hypothetical protein RhiirA4_393605 [Rhizophagus irregularis]
MARAVFKDQLSYNDITINLPILKLLAPSKQSRAKKLQDPISVQVFWIQLSGKTQDNIIYSYI